MKGRIIDNTNAYLDRDLYSYSREFKIIYSYSLELGFGILTEEINEDKIMQSFKLYLDANKDKYYVRHPATMAVGFNKFVEEIVANEKQTRTVPLIENKDQSK